MRMRIYLFFLIILIWRPRWLARFARSSKQCASERACDDDCCGVEEPVSVRENSTLRGSFLSWRTQRKIMTFSRTQQYISFFIYLFFPCCNLPIYLTARLHSRIRKNRLLLWSRPWCPYLFTAQDLFTLSNSVTSLIFMYTQSSLSKKKTFAIPDARKQHIKRALRIWHDLAEAS